jgi:hypothetical protein
MAANVSVYGVATMAAIFTITTNKFKKRKIQINYIPAMIISILLVAGSFT